MLIPWQSSVEMFTQILRAHDVDPAGVADVEAAWRAFGEFLQVQIDGIDPDPDSEADSFIVQWGRYSWNDHQPSLAFTRQLVVVDSADRDDPEWHPRYWQVDLEMRFEDGPDLLGIDTMHAQDTGFRVDPIGPARTTTLAGLRADLDRYPPLHAAWHATPVSSELTLERVC